jgi:hypothetical protein
MWPDVIVQHCVPDMTSVSIVAEQRVPTMGPRFPLLCNNDPGHAGCLLPEGSYFESISCGQVSENNLNYSKFSILF